MRLILARHGETDYNVKCINQGWLPTMLTKHGGEQAFKLGQILRDQKIEKIYCSDLKRTRETAEEILKTINCPVEYVEWLREKNSGIFQGCNRGTFKQYVKDRNLDLFTCKPENGESIQEFQQRIRRSFDKFILENKNLNCVLFVTHGAVITQLILYLLKIDHHEYEKYQPDNCAVTILEINESDIKPIILNHTLK